MPLPAPYQTFSELLGEGQSIGKSRETDKLINLLTDQLANSGSSATHANRASALIAYMLEKNIGHTLWWSSVSLEVADRRQLSRRSTLTSELTKVGEPAFNQAGRLHRALLTVWDEAQSSTAQVTAFNDWCNFVSLSMAVQNNFNVPPAISDTTFTYVTSTQINTGAVINVVAGTNFYLYTTGMGFNSVAWYQDTVLVPGQETERFFNGFPQAADSGEYEARYTNQFGTSVSNTFNVLVT